MSLEFRKFDEPKPSPIPIIQSLIPEREWQATENKSFGKKLFENMDHDSTQKTPNTPTLNQQSTLQLSTLQTATSHLDIETLAGIDHGVGKGNAENIKSDNYVNLNTTLNDAVLTHAVATHITEEIKTKNKKKETHEDADNDSEDTVAKGFTYAHNVNIFRGISSDNPFKKQDKENYDTFENDRYYRLLKDGLMSPLRDLGKDLWDEAQKIIDRIQDRSVKIENIPDPFIGNNINTYTIESNYNAILMDKEQWKDWDQNTFFHFILKRWSDIKNYNKTFRSIAGKANQHQQQGNASSSQPSGTEKTEDSITDILDRIEEVTKIVENSDLTDMSSITQDEIDAMRIETQALFTEIGEKQLTNKELTILANHKRKWDEVAKEKKLPGVDSVSDKDASEYVKKWWEDVGEKLPTVGMVLPFGLMAEVAEKSAKEMALGNWGNSQESRLDSVINSEEDGFLSLAITGYLNVLYDQKLSALLPSNKVTIEDLVRDDFSRAEALFQRLVTQGLLSDNGDIFDGFFTNGKTLEGVSNIPEAEREFLQEIFIRKTNSSHNFSEIDTQKIEGKGRQNIALTLPDGTTATIESLFENLNKEGSLEEKYTAALTTYNTCLDMLMSMMALDKDGKRSGTLQLSKDGNNVSATIYPKASWEEWTKDDISLEKETTETSLTEEERSEGTWKKVEDQPLTMHFKNEKSAQNFFASIKDIVLYLEPIIGTFNPKNTDGPGRDQYVYNNGEAIQSPLRVLIDNVGENGKSGTITAGSAEHKYEIDTLYTPGFFATTQWKASQKYLVNKTAYRLGKESFTKSQENRFFKMQHKKKVEEYNEKKKDHDEKEYERIVSEKKADSKRKNEKTKAENERIKKQKQREAQRIQEEKKAQAQRKQQEAEQKNSAQRKPSSGAKRK